MSTDNKKTFTHEPTEGMWNCKIIGKVVKVKDKKDKPLVKAYHASTATTLQAKGYLKIIDEIEEYVPKTMED